MTRWLSRIPLSIKIIGIWYLLAAVNIGDEKVIGDSFFLGINFPGAEAVLANGSSLMETLLGIGLLCLFEWVRRIAVVYICISMLDTVIHFFHPGIETLLAVQISIAVLVLDCVVLWFLVKRKQAFVKPAEPKQN